MKIKSILSALLLMVSSMASAQKYLNVKLEDGTYHSFEATPNMEISFDKTAREERVVVVNGYKVTVKLADNTPASDVVFCANIEGDAVKIRAFSITNKELMCTWDDNEQMPTPDGGFYYFTISDISKDVVATVKYYPIFTVKFDMKGHGETIQDAKVTYGKTATAPSTPKATLSVFWCWCTDEECTTPYDFSKSVTADLTLYAKWTDGINGHAYVELAGKKWATENVGACGVTAVAGPGKPGNNWNLYFYKQDGNDASNAAQSWGSESNHTWTLPSYDQWNALITNCYWEWTDSYNYLNSPYNGKSGYIVYQAKIDADKNQLNKKSSGYTPTTVPHLFLPAAGSYGGGDISVANQRFMGYYWSSTNGRYLGFRNNDRYVNSANSSLGLAVRPVSE